jgi:hypothetical protein
MTHRVVCRGELERRPAHSARAPTVCAESETEEFAAALTTMASAAAAASATRPAAAFADADAALLAKPVDTLEEKWKLLPAFLSVRTSH